MTAQEIENKISAQVLNITKGIVQRSGSFYGDGSSGNANNNKFVAIHKSASQKEEHVEFQKRCDDLFLVSTILGKPVKELNLFKSFTGFLESVGGEMSELSKAMTTTGSGSGADWIPTDFSRQLEDMLNLERMLVGNLPKITMTTDPFKIPIKKSRSVARKGTQGSAPTETLVGTANVQFSAAKIITYVPLSYELQEDAIVDMLSVIKADIVESIAYGEEDAVLNGDTTGTHMDSDVVSSEDVRKCYKGLRKLALANNYKIDLGTFDSDTIATMIAKLGKYGIRKNRLQWVAGPKVLAKLLTLRDSKDNAVVLTMDKLGQQATFVSGQQGVMFGAPLVAAEASRENLNASGVYDGSVTSKAGLYLAYLPGWKLGEKGGITSEMDRIIKSQTIDLVASKREDLQPVHDITTEPIVCMGYNIAV